jgi:hypothetical protein
LHWRLVLQEWYNDTVSGQSVIMLKRHFLSNWVDKVRPCADGLVLAALPCVVAGKAVKAAHPGSM